MTTYGLSQPYARSRLANNKKLADLLEVVRTSNDRGLLRSLEDLLFVFEHEAQGSRQPPNIEKMMENLLDSTTLRIGDRDFLLCRSVIQKNIERCSLQPKQRKKLSGSLRKFWGTHGEREFLVEYLTLCQCSLKFSDLVGVPVGSSTAHFSVEWCRMRHVLGLADAVHLSLFNMGIHVSFPRREIRRCLPGGHHQKIPIVLLQELESMGLTPRKLKRVFPYKFCSSRGVTATQYVVRSTTKDRRFRLILHFLRVFPKNLKEKEYIKVIKESLVDEFCVQMGQERPTISLVRIPLFPTLTQNKLDKRFAQDRKGKARFYKNLLESKSLCAPVGDDMVHEAYLKHRESLCRPESDLVPVPEDFLQELYQYGKKVGEFVKRIYDPYRTRLPNTRATIEKARSKGGARAFLSSNLEIQKGPLYLSMLDGPTRPEPFVIGLFGSPGSGKTTTVRDLVQLIGLSMFPARTGNDLVYSRSCATEHWDGYEDQPIVVMDDFGQDLKSRRDLVEFEQLVSVNRYVLPMAHLEEKGRTFKSPVIIVTSNAAFGSPLVDAAGHPVVEDDLAVWRRFHLPLRVDRRNKESPFEEYSLSYLSIQREEVYHRKYSGGNFSSLNGSKGWHLRGTLGDIRNVPENRKHFFSGNTWSSVFTLGREIRERFLRHTDFHHQELEGSWRQVVECLSVQISDGPIRPLKNVNVRSEGVPFRDDTITISQIFPRYPPYHRPVVSAVAIKEPLKVRMITKAEANTKCLQPFQRALFEYLKSQPQFVLTHGVMFGQKEEFQDKLEWIYRIENEIKKISSQRKEGDLWLSGDYTAATDNFPMSVTNALIEGILFHIDHEPTKQWVRYEVSPHLIHYPLGIESGVQTSGQLMGSLLSFPLLCFLNDFIVSRSGAERGKYLINGDDVCVLGSPEFISRWKRDAPKVGLSLSLGKNFVDPHFVTINSQLFYNAKVLHTGKVSLSTRYGKTIGRCFSEMQFYYGTDDELRREFIRRNFAELRKTPRSLSVPFTHGGLGLVLLESSLGSQKRAVEVYLSDYLRPYISSQRVIGCDSIRALRVPVGFFSDEEMILAGSKDPEGVKTLEALSSLDLSPDDPDEQEDLSFSEMEKTLRLARLASEKTVNQLINKPDISSFPVLGRLRYRVIFVEKGSVGFLKERILGLCLTLLKAEIDHKYPDPDEEFVSIHREFLESIDPLFGDALHISMEELPIEEYTVADEITSERYEHLLPDLEPRLIPFSGIDGDLVSLVKESGWG